MKIKLLTTILCIAAAQMVAAADNGNWETIFNGQNTNGWKMIGPGELKLENGELVTYGGMGLLWYTPQKFGNCEIKVVFKLTRKSNNSGVFIRIPEPPSDPWYAVNHGYEVQIDNNGNDYHRTGCLYSLTKAINKVDAPIGEWSTMLITLDGPRTIIKVNDKLVTDYTEGTPVPEKKSQYEPERGTRPNEGYIGLQNHGGEEHVHFKEVSVKALDKK